MRKFQFGYAVVALMSACFSPAARAWDQAGHMVIAQIAYDRLAATGKDGTTLDAIAQLTDALNHDALAADTVKKFGPYNAITIAAFMDDLKSTNRTLNKWHYIDLECGATAADVTAFPAPNVYDAIAGKGIEKDGNCLQVLKNAKAPLDERARSFAYLMHFEGDIHQPFHAYGPDQGGNRIKITVPEGMDVTNLHMLWDDVYKWDCNADKTGVALFDESLRHYDTFPRPAAPGQGAIAALAREIETKFAPSAADAADLDPAQWALEGNAIACRMLPKTHAIDAKYVHEAHDIACARMALAGYRLAAVLRACLSPTN